MDYKNSTMTYAYLVGYLDYIVHNQNNSDVAFENWIITANKQIKKFNIQMDDKQFEDLMELYNGSGYSIEKIGHINYIIVGDNDEDDADINGDLYGIVYMKNYEIKLISLADFNRKLFYAKVNSDRTINNSKLDGYNLIKILKNLPITINTLKDKIIGGQVNSVYSLQTNERFISNSDNLIIYDYDTYGFNLEKQVITITHTYGLNPTETFTIILNEIENSLVRDMIMF